MLQLHLHDLLYNLSTSPDRHSLRHVAFDLRVWHELCDHGLLGVLAKMRGLRAVDIVVEFGRAFRGEVGFLEAPEWRGDQRWVAESTGREIRKEKIRATLERRAWKALSVEDRLARDEKATAEEDGDGVQVRCVILTRGGEQA